MPPYVVYSQHSNWSDPLKAYKPDLLIALQWFLEATIKVCKALHDLTLLPITSVNTFSSLPSLSLCSIHTGLSPLLWTCQVCSCLKTSLPGSLFPKISNQFLGKLTNFLVFPQISPSLYLFSNLCNPPPP